MRVFTKISKVPFGHLKTQDHNSVVYVDNLCRQFIDLTPIQTIVFLGFIISSKNMTLIN